MGRGYDDGVGGLFLLLAERANWMVMVPSHGGLSESHFYVLNNLLALSLVVHSCVLQSIVILCIVSDMPDTLSFSF